MKTIYKIKTNIQYQALFFAIIIFFLGSCKTTKHIPEGDLLLTAYEISIEQKDNKVNKGDIDALIKQKPNHMIMGFIPFHLHVYNLIDPAKEAERQKERDERVRLGQEKEDKFYFSKWLQEIGEKPVIWSKFKTAETYRQITQYLKNKGYYQSNVTGAISANKRKVKVTYIIKPGTPFIIDSINYFIEDTALTDIVLNDRKNSKIKRGMRFDVDELQKERERIENNLKNKGYYNFSREFVYYLADTTYADHKAMLTVGIKKYEFKRNDNQYEKPHVKYTIDSISIYTNYDPRKALIDKEKYMAHFERKPVEGKKFVFYTDADFKIKPQTVLRENFVRPDSVFRLDNIKKTYRNLSTLQTFKLVNIKFIEKDSVKGLLNCQILITPQVKQSYTAEIEGSNASGNLGIAGSLTYTNKNLFRGGEIFDFKIRGARETLSNQSSTKLNTNEIGLESNIRFPKFFFPFVSESFSRKYNLRTYFTTIYNYQDRPEYNRNIINLRYGYYWKSKNNPFLRYSIHPIDINMVNITQLDSAKTNYFLRYSYSNHLILSTSFSVNFDNQNIRKMRDHTYFRLNYETAGNMVSLYNNINNSNKNTDDLYEMFEKIYAQYQKIDFDLRYYHKIAKRDWLVTRGFFGIGIPYGNSRHGLPFIKKYYSGGATGIRAWKVRSLGPGSYVDPDDNFFNQTADLKIEANVEYRFKMFWVVEGALFVDGGNIWSITKSDEREGAKFKANRFYHQIALGTGLGLRFDFSFFIIRFDFGLKLRDPSLESGKRWILSNRGYKADDWAFNFGIGYPF